MKNKFFKKKLDLIIIKALKLLVNYLNVLIIINKKVHTFQPN